MLHARRELPVVGAVTPAEACVLIELRDRASAYPNGLRYAEHSPLAAGLSWSQSGLKLPRRGSPTGYIKSFQFRVVVVLTPAGLPTVKSVSMYLPRLAFTAVFPLPNRS